jgi:hypothetical protein
MTRAMKIDKSAVMRRAHREFKYWRKAGEPKSFSDCLKLSWQVARLARDSGSQKYQKRAA